MLTALRSLLYELENRPQEFGEPLYRLHHLQLDLRGGVIAPVSVIFGVNQELRVVALNKVSLLSDPKGQSNA
jgi:hypothetical protein